MSKKDWAAYKAGCVVGNILLVGAPLVSLYLLVRFIIWIVR